MTVHLELIDSHQGLPVQVFDVAPGRVSQIGRSEEADVVIAHPFVSRAHAYLQEGAGGWELVGISDKGVFVNGERRETVPLEDGVEFRLASKGPLMRFRNLAADRQEDTSATINFDEEHIPLLVLDRDRLSEEVTAIVENDYFAEVQKIAAALKRKNALRTR